MKNQAANPGMISVRKKSFEVGIRKWELSIADCGSRIADWKGAGAGCIGLNLRILIVDGMVL